MLTGILGSPLVETVIGLFVVWFLAASLCSGVVELIGSAFGFRANHLWGHLSRLLRASGSTPDAAGVEAARLATAPVVSGGDPLAAFVDALPGVDAESVKRVRQIDSRLAAQALVVARGAAGFDDSPLGQVVNALPASVRDDEERLQKWFEEWFDDRMSLVRAGYRRKIRWWAAFVGIFVVLFTGLDSLGLAERLYAQPAQRTLLQAEAARLVDSLPCASTPSSGPTTTSSTPAFRERLACARETAGRLSQFEISYWQVARPTTGWSWARTVVGTLLSWAAVLAGAPFWYALLKRVMTLQTKGGQARSEAR